MSVKLNSLTSESGLKASKHFDWAMFQISKILEVLVHIVECNKCIPSVHDSNNGFGTFTWFACFVWNLFGNLFGSSIQLASQYNYSDFDMNLTGLESGNFARSADRGLTASA